MEADRKSFDQLVQQLYDVHVALAALARLPARDDMPAFLDERDRLAGQVLDGAATAMSRLFDQPVSRASLEQLARSEAAYLLTPALRQRQDETRAALRDLVERPAARRSSEPGSESIAGAALAIGVGVLAATVGTPLAALAVGDPVTKEIVKAAITGVVASTVTEVSSSIRRTRGRDLNEPQHVRTREDGTRDPGSAPPDPASMWLGRRGPGYRPGRDR